jgi:hypothetical protein
MLQQYYIGDFAVRPPLPPRPLARAARLSVPLHAALALTAAVLPHLHLQGGAARAAKPQQLTARATSSAGSALLKALLPLLMALLVAAVLYLRQT